MSYRRVYAETIYAWLFKRKLILPAIMGLFAFLLLSNDIAIVSYSGDSTCSICYAEINFTMNRDYIYIYPNTSWYFNTDRKLSKIELQVRDWRMKSGWKTLDLTKTASKDVTYAYRFYKSKGLWEVRIVGYKDNPQDTIKWSFGSIDPYWYGEGTVMMVGSSLSRYTNEYRIVERSGFEGRLNVTIKYLKSGNSSLCLWADTTEINMDKTKTKPIPLSIKLTRSINDSLLKNIDVDLVKSSTNIKPTFEKGDELQFCYEADPAIDDWVRFGEESVTFVKSVYSDFFYTNMTTLTSNAVQPSLNLPSLYSNLTGYWSFDTDATPDLSKKFVPGMVGMAFNATATGDYIQFSNNTQFNFSLSGGTVWPLNQSFSLAVWIQSRDNCATNKRGIISKGNFGVAGYVLGCTGNVGTMRYYFAIRNTSASNNMFEIQTDVSQYGNWTHLVAVFNGTANFLYVNGTLQQQQNQTLNGSYFYTNSYPEIGRGQNSDNYQIFGSIDEVYIYNRSLSAGEAVSLWLNDGNVTKDLVAYFQMENFSGGSILRSANSLETLWGGYMGAGLILVDHMNAFAGTYKSSTATAAGTSTLDGISGAYQVSGEGDYAAASASGFVPTINDASNDTTIMAWYRDTTNSSAFYYLYAESNTTSNTPVLYFGTQAGWFIANIRNATDTSGIVIIEAGARHYDGKWHHGAFIRNYTGLYLVVDGVITRQALDTLHYKGIAGFDRKTLGKGLIYTSQRSPGYVDEVMTFNTSLSLAQIVSIMNNQSQRFRNLSAGLMKAVNVTERGIDNRANLSVTNLTLLTGTTVFGTVCGWANETASGFVTDADCQAIIGFNATANGSYGDVCGKSTMLDTVPSKYALYGNASYFATGTDKLTFLNNNLRSSLTAYLELKATTAWSLGSDDVFVMGKYDRTNTDALGWALVYNAGTPGFEYWYGDGAEAWSYYSVPAITFDTGTHSVAVVLDDAANTSAIYWDGVQKAAAPYLSAEVTQYFFVGWDGGANATHGITPLANGDASDAVNNQFSGYIDDVMVFNRTFNDDDRTTLFATGPRKYACDALQTMTASGANYTFDFDQGYTDMTAMLIGTTGGFWPLYVSGYANVSLYNVVTAPPADTCTYTSGNWDINCADNCTISTAVDMAGNNVTVWGSGLITFTNNITNIGRATIGGLASQMCVVRCQGGCLQLG